MAEHDDGIDDAPSQAEAGTLAGEPPTPARADGELRRLLGDRDFRTAVDAYERDLIADALERAGGHQGRAAEILGVLPTTLSSKIKRLERRGMRVRSTPSDDVLEWRLRLAEGVVEISAPGAHVDVEASADDEVCIEVRLPTDPAAPAPEVRLVRTATGARVALWPAAAREGAAIRVQLPRGVRLRTAAEPVPPTR